MKTASGTAGLERLSSYTADVLTTSDWTRGQEDGIAGKSEARVGMALDVKCRGECLSAAVELGAVTRDAHSTEPSGAGLDGRSESPGRVGYLRIVPYPHPNAADEGGGIGWAM